VEIAFMNNTYKNRVVLGVDIGGTNSKFGYVDSAGACRASASIPTYASQPPEVFFERLHSNSMALLRSLPEATQLVGIGIGAPNANYRKGTIEHPPNLAWDYVDVRAQLAGFYDAPVAVTNDANAAALGEMLFGAAQGMKDFIVITLGTGLGSGIVANGELIYGADGFAGEIGHTIVDPNGRECGCGKRGCLETYCSATGLCRTVQDILGSSPEQSLLRNINVGELTAEMISIAALGGDPLALRAFEQTGYILGLKLSDSVAHLSPEAIILVGGLAAAGDLIFAPTKRSLEEHVFPIFRNKVKLIPSTLIEGNTAVLGASALMWNALGKI
jgi:glucokinase